MDRASGFPALTYGARSAPGTYLCHTARPALPDFLPTAWLSDTDQTSEVDDIFCERIGAPHARAARTVLKLLTRGLP